MVKNTGIIEGAEQKRATARIGSDQEERRKKQKKLEASENEVSACEVWAKIAGGAMKAGVKFDDDPYWRAFGYFWNEDRVNTAIRGETPYSESTDRELIIISIHELAHATGSNNRLKRNPKPEDREACEQTRGYQREELVAWIATWIVRKKTRLGGIRDNLAGKMEHRTILTYVKAYRQYNEFTGQEATAVNRDAKEAAKMLMK